MKHDEQCEAKYWRKILGDDTWQSCYCAVRAYCKEPFDDYPIYAGIPLTEDTEEW